MSTGYDEAIRLAKAKLTNLDLNRVCEATGAILRDGEPLIPWFNDICTIDGGSETEQILWLHYLTYGGDAPLTGRMIAFRELPSAAFYEPKFSERAERPLIKRFGDAPEAFIEAGLKLDGKKTGYGDAAMTLKLLPRVPVTYILWRGDGELPAECRILFDSSAQHYLPTEDLTVLASLGAYRLIKA